VAHVEHDAYPIGVARAAQAHPRVQRLEHNVALVGGLTVELVPLGGGVGVERSQRRAAGLLVRGVPLGGFERVRQVGDGGLFLAQLRLVVGHQAVAALSRLLGSGIVLIDNLQVHVEGRQFLEMVCHEPDLRARLRTICTAVEINCTRAREEYGDVLDAYLVMPFTVTQLVHVLEA
jgi:hypothetical protein